MNAELIRLQAIARCFDCRVTAATPVTGGFSGARVWRATTAEGELLAIRSVPLSAGLPEARQQSLADFLRDLYAAGISTIAVPRTVSPDVTTSLLMPRQAFLDLDDYRWSVEPWKPGASVQAAGLTAPRLSAALTALQQFHAAARDVVIRRRQPDISQQWFRAALEPSPAIIRRWQMLELRTTTAEQELTTARLEDPDPVIRTAWQHFADTWNRCRAGVLRELMRLAAQRVTIQPVLRDVRDAHVLFTGDDVTGLIDCTAMASDHPAIDYARLLRSWFSQDDTSFQAAADQLFSRGILQESDRALFAALDASSLLLSPLTWLTRRREYLSGGASAALPEWTDEHTRRLRTVAETASSVLTSPGLRGGPS